MSGLKRLCTVVFVLACAFSLAALALTWFGPWTAEVSALFNLEPFAKCVSIFGNSKLLTTTLQMTYSSDEKSIKLILDENEYSRLFP